MYSYMYICIKIYMYMCVYIYKIYICIDIDMNTIYIRAAPAGTISAFFPMANTTSPPSSAP